MRTKMETGADSLSVNEVLSDWPDFDDTDGSILSLANALHVAKPKVADFLGAREEDDKYTKQTMIDLLNDLDGVRGFNIRRKKSLKRQIGMASTKIATEFRRSDFGWAVCPISHDIMKQPVVTECGHAMDKKSYRNIRRMPGSDEKLCPMCRNPINKVINVSALNKACEWVNNLPKDVKNSMTN